jgi:flagellar FliJ protein
MSKFRALELAIVQATQQRDARARTHAQAQQSLHHAQEQLTQLQNYSNDTDARWIGGHAVNLSVELIKHHYQFMERLQSAVALQQGVIVGQESQLQAAQQALLQAEFRLAGFKQVLKTRRAALAVQQQRREQRITDEFAATRHAQAAATLEETQ